MLHPYLTKPTESKQDLHLHYFIISQCKSLSSGSQSLEYYRYTSELPIEMIAVDRLPRGAAIAGQTLRYRQRELNLS